MCEDLHSGGGQKSTLEIIRKTHLIAVVVNYISFMSLYLFIGWFVCLFMCVCVFNVQSVGH